MKTKPTTDPYGELVFVIGDADDFWCFDYHAHADGTTTLHACINSETGSFIMDAEKPIRVPNAEAVSHAKRLTQSALEWLQTNEVTHDQAGWNQSPCYFWRAVHCSIAKNGPAIPIPVQMVRRPLITRNYL